MYKPGSFRPLAQVQDDKIYHYHLDHLGTPKELSNDEGRIVWKAKYKTYGNLAFKEVAEVENNLRFQGQYFDEETGLHYNRFRYYSPDTGQFINQDPIGLLGGLNNYQYAPNPVQWVDPLGLTCKEQIEKLMQSSNPVDRQKAVDMAGTFYGINMIGVKSITYDHGLEDSGRASKDGTIIIGSGAFTGTAGWLGSTLAHEIEVHIQKQALVGNWWSDEQGTMLQEVEAYDYEITNADRFGISPEEKNILKQARDEEYQDLNYENK